MCQYICLSENNKYVQDLFLSLPKKLYKSKDNPQEIKIEKDILNKTHTLSTNFDILPFVVIRKNDNKVISRCILTFYENDEASYVGFFESYDDEEAVKVLFNEVNKCAKDNNKKQLIGPLDCSFWINYRFKINNFDNTYTGEPINKDYYPKLWQKFGFCVSEHYTSDYIRIPSENDVNQKCKKRLKYILDKGYKFVHPTSESYINELENIYELLINLYSSFPGFKYISKEQFVSLFSSLKLILDFKMVYLVYKGDKLCGFMICIPNYYGFTNGKINIFKIKKILSIRKRPKEYVIMYMGVDKDSLGLGGAIAEILKNKLCEYNSSGVRALVHDGKVTAHYYEQLNVKKTDYVLLSKNIGGRIFWEK